MRHRINGCPINLRGLTDAELSALDESTVARQERVQEELDSIRGEAVRRSTNVIPLFADHAPLTVA